jgi:hypothetical protein
VEEPLLPEEPLLKVGDSIPQPAPVDILESDMEGSIVHYGSIPVGIDTNRSSRSFDRSLGRIKPWFQCGCLLMDAKTVLDKLKIVNFWRCLDNDGVKLWKGRFTQIYKRPTVSNDRKPIDQFA